MQGNGRKRKMGENGCPLQCLDVVRIHEGAREGGNFWLSPIVMKKIRR